MGFRRTWLYGFAALTLFTAACAASSNKKSDDDDDGGTSTGSGTTASCSGACQRQVAANCSAGTDQTTCVSDCEAAALQVAEACKDEYDAVISCSASRGTVTCDVEGVPELEGCDTELTTYIQCASNTATSSSVSSSTSTSTSSSSSSGSGGSTGCYAGQGSCDPLVASSCSTGEACDIDSNYMFTCFPPPNTAGVGQACDNSAGPYCQHGLACDAAVCREYCCSTADCTTGTCQQVGTAGSIVIQVCK